MDNKNNNSIKKKPMRTPQLRVASSKNESVKEADQSNAYVNPWISSDSSVSEVKTTGQEHHEKPRRRPIRKIYKNRTTHLNSIIIYATFMVALVAVGIMTLLIPDKDISTRENRALAQFPKISSESILSGKISSDLDSWYSDQFPGRDSLVTIWKKIDGALSLQFTDDDITIVEGSDDLGQGALDPDAPEDQSDPLYTSPFFGGGEGENPNP